MGNTRARLMILSELMSFPTINNKYWRSDFGDDKPQVGDLVSLTSAEQNVKERGDE